MRPLFAALAALLLLSGCAINSSPARAAQQPSQGDGTAGGNFTVPPPPVPYSARYIVSESGGETEKSVWRLGSMARVRMGNAGANVELFFLGSRAYSCSALPSGASCFEITGRMAGTNLSQVFPLPADFSGAEEVGSVDIGGTRGNCYLVPYAVFSKRKVCFTDRGVLAYDEYNATRTQTHVEYLTDIVYSASEADFALPSAPTAAPG